MVKGENDIVKDWVMYHGNLFGYKNLYIIDNFSRDGTYEIIQEFKDLINIYREPDYKKKGEYMTKLIKHNSYGNDKIAFPIDIDEFIVYYDKDSNSKEISIDKDLINNYIKYDYSGAPWKKSIINSNIIKYDYNGNSGNGGLSLRRKSKMLEILNNCEYKNEPEDVYFSKGCNNIFINKPNIEDAKLFSVESIYNNISFGVHKPWLFMNKQKLENKNNFCNGLDKIIKFNRK
jgi:hypothetical protein